MNGNTVSFPMNDKQCQLLTIVAVKKEPDGWSIERSDGWSFFVPADSPIEPKAGMAAAFYGRGVGYAVRGLFLDGNEVFYRTEAEEKERFEIEMYGADAADWLRRWDRRTNRVVYLDGGIGPGYEQSIQITTAEMLRHLLAKADNQQAMKIGVWILAWGEIDTMASTNPRITALGLSGSQWQAAKNLAEQLYTRGPRAVMTDERVKDRQIQVNRTFPGATA